MEKTLEIHLQELRDRIEKAVAAMCDSENYPANTCMGCLAAEIVRTTK